MKGLSEKVTFDTRWITGRNQPRSRIGVFLAQGFGRAKVFSCRNELGLWQEQGIEW